MSDFAAFAARELSNAQLAKCFEEGPPFRRFRCSTGAHEWPSHRTISSPDAADVSIRTLLLRRHGQRLPARPRALRSSLPLSARRALAAPPSAPPALHVATGADRAGGAARALPATRSPLRALHVPRIQGFGDFYCSTRIMRL